MGPKDADGMDPDQEQSDLGLHSCPDLSVQKTRTITVAYQDALFGWLI